MKKVTVYILLVLHVVLFNFGQNAYSASSALTKPPADMSGINEMHKVLKKSNSKIRFGTHADPKIITLGPQKGGPPGYAAYKGKTSMNIKMPLDTPVLAPTDMALVGFDNRSAIRHGKFTPFDDLELCFESTSQDWPNMVVCFYHLRTSPLLPGHLINKKCWLVKKWLGSSGSNASGRILYLMNESFYGKGGISSAKDPKPCKAEIGRFVKRGEIIGFSGQVGKNEHVAIKFKVKSDKLNPLTLSKLPKYKPKFKPTGDPYLHWVQPVKFFYWKCFSPQTEFSDGVLAYPFQCND